MSRMKMFHGPMAYDIAFRVGGVLFAETFHRRVHRGIAHPVLPNDQATFYRSGKHVIAVVNSFSSGFMHTYVGVAACSPKDTFQDEIGMYLALVRAYRRDGE